MTNAGTVISQAGPGVYARQVAPQYAEPNPLDNSEVEDLVNRFKKENEQVKLKNAALLREIGMVTFC